MKDVVLRKGTKEQNVIRAHNMGIDMWSNRGNNDENTYAGSNDDAGCEAAKLCAKLRLPPANCPLDELWRLLAPPIGTFPPKAHPAALFALHSKPDQPLIQKIPFWWLNSSPVPIFPFGNRLDPALPGCWGCCWPPKGVCIPLSVCGTAPDDVQY